MQQTRNVAWKKYVQSIYISYCIKMSYRYCKHFYESAIRLAEWLDEHSIAFFPGPFFVITLFPATYVLNEKTSLQRGNAKYTLVI